MAEDSRGSCLTATTTIIVASVGAAATIIAALITHWPSRPSPAPAPTPASVVVTPQPAPQESFQPPRRDSTPAPSLSLQGIYAVQSQNIFQAPVQATMTFVKESDDAYRWQLDYVYYTNPYVAFQSTGELINDGGQWLQSMDDTTEPGAQTFSNLPVGVELNRNVLTVSDGAGHMMTMRKR